MDIIVDCPCGQPFAFREEPVNNRLKVPVACPSCGRDGTDQANRYIQNAGRGQPFPARPQRSLPNFGLGRSRPRLEANDWLRPKDDAPAAAPVPQAATAPAGRMVLGAAAALAVGALSAAGWYWVAMKTGFHFGILAWVIGAVVGLICRLIAPNGGLTLAAFSGTAAFAAILAGHVLVLQVEVDNLIVKGVDRAYQMSLDYAHQALALKNDESIKQFLAEHSAKTASLDPKGAGEDGQTTQLTGTQRRELYYMSMILFEVMDRDKVGLPRVSELKNRARSDRYGPADIQEFQKAEVPELQRLIQGTPSAEEWKSALSAAIYERIRFKDLVSASIGPHTIAWMLFGLITAFKLAQNKSETEET
jgi:hypothetical protein